MKRKIKGKPGWVTYRREPGTPPTVRMLANLKKLAAMPDSEIDTSDIPVLPPEAWKHAIRGGLYRPVKKAVSLRIDADVLAWLRKDGKGYQTRVNRLLRQEMLKELAGYGWEISLILGYTQRCRVLRRMALAAGA